MTFAMMLPTTLPLVAMFRAAGAGQAGPRRAARLLLLAGYLAAWTVFGIVVARRSALIRAWNGGRSPGSGATRWLVGRGGLPGRWPFQFSDAEAPLPGQVPIAAELHHGRWRGLRADWRAFRLGVAHGSSASAAAGR